MYQAQQRQPKIKDIHTAKTTYTTQFYQSYIANNKPNKHNSNNQNNDINMGFTTNTKFVLLQLTQHIFWSIHIQILTNFVHFIHHQFVHFIDPEEPVHGLRNNFVHFIHPYMKPLPTTLEMISSHTFSFVRLVAWKL